MGLGVEIGLPTSEHESALLKPVVEAALVACHQEGDPLTFYNVYIWSALVASEQRSMDVAMLMADIRKVYGYVYKHQKELGVQLYADKILPHLDIDPDSITNPSFVETAGQVFIEELPRTYRQIKTARRKPTLGHGPLNERGLVASLWIANDRLMLKSWQGSQEHTVTAHLSRYGLAPRLYEAGASVFVEEYIDALPVMNFSQDPQFVARCCGSTLVALHKQGVIYDHHMLNELMVEPIGGSIRLRVVDLGHAYFGRDFETDWEYQRNELTRFYTDSRSRDLALVELRRWEKSEA
jgi:hypothetical protein